MVKLRANPDECWLWARNVNWNDYGFLLVKVDGEWKNRMAHRIVYEALVAPIPEGLIIDHLCRVHRCVNPEHLEPVTYSENLKRGLQYMADKTHCRKGHEFTDKNTQHHPKGTRICRKCRRARDWHWRRKVGRAKA